MTSPHTTQRPQCGASTTTTARLCLFKAATSALFYSYNTSTRILAHSGRLLGCCCCGRRRRARPLKAPPLVASAPGPPRGGGTLGRPVRGPVLTLSPLPAIFPVPSLRRHNHRSGRSHLGPPCPRRVRPPSTPRPTHTVLALQNGGSGERRASL